MALFYHPSNREVCKAVVRVTLKTLMMYPIIVAIFAIGDVLGTVILNSGTDGALGGQLASTLTGLMVLFAPMFMIPFSFQIAGGAISTIYGHLQRATSLYVATSMTYNGRFPFWSNSARERGKEAYDAGLDRAGGSLAALGSPGRWAGRGTRSASNRVRDRAYRKAYNRHYNGYLNGDIDPTTGVAYTDPGTFDAWVRTQRAGNQLEVQELAAEEQVRLSRHLQVNRHRCTANTRSARRNNNTKRHNRFAFRTTTGTPSPLAPPTPRSAPQEQQYQATQQVRLSDHLQELHYRLLLGRSLHSSYPTVVPTPTVTPSPAGTPCTASSSRSTSTPSTSTNQYVNRAKIKHYATTGSPLTPPPNQS